MQVKSFYGGKKHRDCCRIEPRAIEQARVGKICDGIYWGVAIARTDKRTGFVGQVRPCSEYVQKACQAVMRKWARPAGM